MAIRAQLLFLSSFLSFRSTQVYDFWPFNWAVGSPDAVLTWMETSPSIIQRRNKSNNIIKTKGLAALQLKVSTEQVFNEDLTGQLIDGQLFRLVCSLDSADNPQFSIKIIGRAANSSTLFQVTFSKGSASDSYRMTLVAGLTPETMFIPGYNLLIDEEGTPQIPVVMTYGKGVFISASSGQGTYVNSTSQSVDLAIVNVMATGLNLVECSCVETGKL